MFLKVSNDLFQMSLPPAAMKVYVYLSYCAKNHKAIVKVSTIQNRCNIHSPATVYKALKELSDRGLVRKERRQNYEGAIIANAYTVKALPGKWFKLINPLAAFCLDNRSFVVYLYYCRKSRKGVAWPSLRRTASETRLCKNTVIRALRLLQKLLGLLRMSWQLKAGNNVYSIAALAIKKCAPSVSHNEQRTVLLLQNKKPCGFIISALARFVNSLHRSFSFLPKAVHFLKNSL